MKSSKPRVRSLRQANGKSSGLDDYEPPSLRSKPRQKRDSANDQENINGHAPLSEDEEMAELDEPDELDELDEDSDFSMDGDFGDVDPNDDEERITVKRKHRQRQQQQQQQHDTSFGSAHASNGTSNSRLKQLEAADELDLTLSSNNISTSAPAHHGRKRKLRSSNTPLSASVYNGILSQDYDFLDQDLDLPFTDKFTSAANESHFKKPKTSPLVLGSPSKVKISNRQSPASSHNTPAALLDESMDISPSIQIGNNSNKWRKKQPIAPFLDKLGKQVESHSLDLSQHSILPADFFEPARKGSSAKTRTMDESSSMDEGGSSVEQHSSTLTATDDVMVDSASQGAFDNATSEKSEPQVAPTLDIAMPTEPVPQTEIINPTEPVPGISPETKANEGFLRRITRFFFG